MSDTENTLLTRPFSKEEFKEAIFQMHADKAPRPNGINSGFYQKFWHAVGNEVSDEGMKWIEDVKFP